MIKKIVFFGIFLCLCIAVPLALMGYDHVTLGPSFIALMRNCNNDLNNFTIAIPNIPTIPRIPTENGAGDAGILEVLINLANALITFVNVIINIINVAVQVINIVIQLIEFIVILIKNLITFKDSVTSSPFPVV